GYEWDVDADNGARPAGLIGLSTTTIAVNTYLLDYGSAFGNGIATHRLTLYRAASGALVFGAGPVQWAWGLDDGHALGDDFPIADLRVQQATANLFADMGTQPASLQPWLVAPLASTDTAAPTSTITSPANGAAVQVGSPIPISGTAADSGGQVAAVEVSV